MRKFVVVTAIIGSLTFAAAALAVLPAASKSFAGVTSERPINGFRATVTFKTSPGGRTVRNFTFQTLGCFGHGQFPVGTDPYAETLWRIKTMPVGPKGDLSAKVLPTTTVPDSGTMSATVSGSFVSPSRFEGKVVLSQVLGGADCGPRTVKFAATSS